ncbi:MULTISPECIES: hypothetical protein [unclassified Rhizobium]|nr:MULTISPECIES: hypothetical protein [unclassified Rhizobium]KQS90418.1 hypothetical protein ASG50_08210 [Rhizobium sp. Leaf386]KQS90677.1 hypothetical protein ASG42_09070 [Rhizobium sp. Leaf391]KQU10159.1 hypothetical protein ASG68_04080 [Rhizobium sp. Leaf453]
MSAGAIAALVGFLLLAQGLFGGLAQGTMASAAVDPFNILCIAHETDAAQKQGPGDPVHGVHDLCATLCQFAASVTPVLPSHVAGILSPVQQAGKPQPAREILPAAVPRGNFAEARAPPILLRMTP